MKFYFIFLILLIYKFPFAIAISEKLDHKSAVEDILQLQKVLEDSHPDPFRAIGGRVAFYSLVNQTIKNLPEKEMTIRDYYAALLPIVAAVKDGHTGLYDPYQNNKQEILPFKFAVIDKKIVITEVAAKAHEALIGSFIVEINGAAIETLLKKMKQYKGYDNEYQNYENFIKTALYSSDMLKLILPGVDEYNLQMKLSNLKHQFKITAGFQKMKKIQWITATSRLKLPVFNSGDIASGFIGRNDEVAYFGLKSMMNYREAFEDWKSSGLKNMLVENFESRPSISEEILTLLRMMKQKKTKKLIIDLGKAKGGNSLGSDILQHFLFSLDDIVTVKLTGYGGYSVPRYSKLFEENYDKDGEHRFKKKNIAIGDYDFGMRDKWLQLQKNGVDKAKEKYLHELDFLVKQSPTFAKFAKDVSIHQIDDLEITVVSSSTTYSAAYSVLTMLQSHGAKIVGVPSSQCGNCFIDSLKFSLKNSQIKGYVSYQETMLFPDDLVKGNLLKPDRELTYDDFQKAQFDPNAAVLKVLDY